MNRKIILIVVGAILVAILMALLWMWFFTGSVAQPGTGDFGSAGDANRNGGAGDDTTNLASDVIPADFGLDATGAHVTAMQNLLIAKGFLVWPPGGRKGTFDQLTQRALMQFQTSVGLNANGYVNAPTANALNAALRNISGTINISAYPGGRNVVLNLASSSTGTGTGIVITPNADWLGNNANLSNFIPSGINDLNQGQIGGQVAIFGTPPPPDTANNSLNAGLFAAAGIAGALTCTPGLLGAVSGLIGNVGIGGSAVAAPLAVPVWAPGTDAILTTQLTTNNVLKSSDTYKTNFLDCLTRVWAKVILQQITNSVVNWINSGFNGQPSFVQNFNQFFNKVADQAAGEFIKGSSLSFLCSPFQAQIRLAIARSYAQRNAQSCTFTSIVGNFTRFTNGTFNQGGWRGMLQLTTMPTNNPYGAFMYAQGGLSGAQSTATGNKRVDLVNGRGFLSFEKQVNCRVIPLPEGQQGPPQTKCDTQIATPGSTIAETLNITNKSSVDSLNLAKSFDEIISALIYQLMTKMLQNGLSSLSGTNGYASNFLTPDQQQAQTTGQTLLTGLQNVVQVAQQYGTVEQGSIRDLQTVQEQYLSLQNCWELASGTPTLTQTQQALAATRAAAAGAEIIRLQSEVDAHNTNITRANASISLLQELQTRTLSVGSTADVSNIQTSLTQAQNAGLIILPADLTQAQQDRAALQTRLTGYSQQISAGLQQCNAFH